MCGSHILVSCVSTFSIPPSLVRHYELTTSLFFLVFYYAVTWVGPLMGNSCSFAGVKSTKCNQVVRYLSFRNRALNTATDRHILFKCNIFLSL